MTLHRLLALLAASATALAQQPITLEDAVAMAVATHPSIEVSRARSDAATAAIAVARTAFLPRVSTLLQVNRATTNNVYGMLLQQQTISPISGPPVLANRATSVFGSAAGALVNWEAFDFGLRNADVAASEAAKRHADRSMERRQFDLGVAAADAFLTVLAADQQVRAAEAGLDRARVFAQSVDALAQAGLRPGAEAARARSELAASEAGVVQARQAAALARAALAEYTGSPDARISPRRLLDSAPAALTPQPSGHPALREQQSAIEEVQARERVLDLTALPKLAVEGTAFARGTGARADLTFPGGANGLAPNFYNWGLGISLRWDPLASRVSAESKRVEIAHEREEQARLAELRRELDTGLRKAAALLDGARGVARVIPDQLEAARATNEQASARYRAGLGTISDVAEAQQLLTRAEIDSSLAQLAIWRGLLATAAAQGDLTPFLEAAR